MSRRHRGISLLETIASIAIFAAIVASLFEVFTTGYRRMRDTKMFSTAKFLAQEAMENYSYWDSRVASAGTKETKGAVSGFPDFQREVVVTSENANLSRVNVTVYWTGRNGEKNLSLSAYVANVSF